MAVIDLTGKLIAVEGLDFTGKSTLIPLLADRLRATGLTVVESREPGGTKVGELIRTILLAPEHVEMLPLSELLLFLVSRAQHWHQVVLPALNEGHTVITSRFRLSSMAYQGHGRGIDLDLIRRLNDATTGGREADVTLLIDVPVHVALARKKGSGDRIEEEDAIFYERVRAGYLKLMRELPNAHVIDGTAPIPDVEAMIARCLDM